ncbi:MAG: hypothetical protein LBF22_09715 [Deltaproteobacteria bacterium]|jgi:chromosome segregation ATPase|nr:hypothetical protein [Deltaproteobacteria bacterium]
MFEKNNNSDDLSFEKVYNAVCHLSVNNQKITVRDVQAYLGVASTSTIHKHYNKVLKMRRTLPIDSQDKLAPVLSSLTEYARDCIYETTQMLEAERENYSINSDNLINDISNLEKENLKLKTELGEMTSSNKNLIFKLDNTEKALLEARNDIDKYKHELSTIKIRQEDYEKVKLETEKLKEKHLSEIKEYVAKVARYEERLESMSQLTEQEKSKSEKFNKKTLN